MCNKTILRKFIGPSRDAGYPTAGKRNLIRVPKTSAGTSGDLVCGTLENPSLLANRFLVLD
jgi:hypothetical protein